MRLLTKQFLHTEDGAVTVDWIVISAAIVSLGMGGVSAAKDGLNALNGNTANALLTKTVNLDD